MALTPGQTMWAGIPTTTMTRLMAIIQDNPGKLVPECLHTRFYRS